MRLLFAILSSVVLASCAPTVIVKKKEKPPAVTNNDGFIVITENDTFTAHATVLGDIRVTDNGFTINCKYDRVLDIAKKQAVKLGANCLRIYKHKLPNFLGSNCHRISAQALLLADVTPYEKTLDWEVQRRLKIKDFKADTVNRPFQAATVSYISCLYKIKQASHNVTRNKVEITVKSKFDCYRSYFKGASITTLAHEQGHFDLTELYARKLRKLFREQVHTMKDFNESSNKLYTTIADQLQIAQDKYDSEIYPDRSKQEKWLLDIKQQLDSAKEFQNPVVILDNLRMM